MNSLGPGMSSISLSATANNTGQGTGSLFPQPEVGSQRMIAYARRSGQKIPTAPSLFAFSRGPPTSSDTLLTVFNNTTCDVRVNINHAKLASNSLRDLDLYTPPMFTAEIGPEAPWLTTRVDATFSLLIYAIKDENGVHQAIELPLASIRSVDAGQGAYYIDKNVCGVGPAGYTLRVDESVPAVPDNTVVVSSRISSVTFTIAVLKNGTAIQYVIMDPTSGRVEFSLPDKVCVSVYSYYQQDVVDELIGQILVEPGKIVWVVQAPDGRLSLEVTSNLRLLQLPTRKEIETYEKCFEADPNAQY